MRLYELCRDCKHYEHNWDIDRCWEYCHHSDEKIWYDKFVDSEETITECEGFEEGVYSEDY